MEFREFLENREITVRGKKYNIRDILMQHDALQKKYSDDERFVSCTNNGYDTAIELGYRGSEDFDLVAKIFIINTAHYEYEMY